MKTQAAVLVELGKPLELVDLEIPELKPGQVLVKIAYSGVCHTQVSEVRGHRGDDPYVPHCLGHEASGTVVKIGAGVTKVSPDDEVVLSWIKGSGMNVPGTVYQWGDRKVNAGGVTTFAQYSVISENRITRKPESISMQEAALFGCALPTGAGSVFNVAQPKAGESLVVFGAGGIGCCAISSANATGCYPIIAVDILDSKLELAQSLGATHCINASNTEDVVAEIKKVVQHGVDYAIEATGLPSVMNQALSCVRMQGGAAIVIGNARYGETMPLDPSQLNQGKKLLGTWGGDSQPDEDIPRLAKLVAAGKVIIEPLMTKVYKLEEINDAIDDLEAGRVARPLIEM